MNLGSVYRNLFAIVCFLFLFDGSAVQAKKKLNVFILAGQSNMVGFSDAHTIAALFETGKERDRELARMVFGSNSEKIEKIIKKQIARAKILDELTGGRKQNKVTGMSPGPEKKSLEARIFKLMEKQKRGEQQISAACVGSNRVYINSEAGLHISSGKFSIGYGREKDRIGPEYSFGLTIADMIEGPILLIKASYGGKSLHYDFRSPSSSEFPFPDEMKKGTNAERLKQAQEGVGKYYRRVTDMVSRTLANLKEYHPDYDEEAGYEIVGFVWFQGFNDQFGQASKDNYESNMLNFIKDVRKEFQSPEMPFIIGVLGTDMRKVKVDENKVVQGQRAAAKALGFKGNVLAVESYLDYSLYTQELIRRSTTHWHEWSISGSDKIHHYLGSGIFFVRVGNSFALAMQKLISKE